MRQRLTIHNVESDGRVYARSEDGRVSLTCPPDPVQEGWKVGDVLDVLAAPDRTGSGGGGSLLDKLPRPPGTGRP